MDFVSFWLPVEGGMASFKCMASHDTIPVLGLGLCLPQPEWICMMFLLFRLCCEWDYFFLVYIAIFFITSQFLFFHFDLQSSRTGTKHAVCSTRSTCWEFKLVKKWLAFLKLYVCIYLGVDIIMFLWYSSCWVWNAGVSKARRRSQTKAWIEVRISMPLSGGSWERSDFV